MRRAALVASVVALLMACGSFEGPRALGPTPSATPLKLPQPIAQPITRTSSAAQTAWLWSSSQSQDRARSLIGVNPSGQIVGQLDEAALAGATGVWRSANGATLFIGRESLIAAHSAVDGKLQRVYKSKPTGSTVASAVSPDGRWLALLSAGPDPRVQVIDLTADVAQALPVVHDPNAKLPGLTGGTAATVWGTVAFGPDSTSLYALTDWGGPARVTAFTLAGDRLAQTGTAVDAQSGRRFPSCAGPAAAASVSALAKALVIFCHVDGAIWFFDLNALGNVTVVQADQPNPFWLSPIFTPDGQLLYLHQWPGFGDKMQVVELSSRRMLGPVPTPTKVGDPGPFSWRMPIAYAGGTASTVPISPDGLKLYSGTANGVIVLRVPDLKPLAKLAPGLNVNEVWVSGDGRTLYATAENGKGLFVIREDGSAVIPVSTPTILGGFISTERG